jgi:hypothetical protein
MRGVYAHDDRDDDASMPFSPPLCFYSSCVVSLRPQACLGGANGPYQHVGKFVFVFVNGDVVIDPSVIEKNFMHGVSTS